MPDTKPAGAARRSGSATNVYASWNGATKLASWRVLGAATRRRPVPSRSRAGPRSGFETAIPVPGGSASFEVQALDAGGRVLGTSGPFGAG